jgi:recombination associated protein RdgC
MWQTAGTSTFVLESPMTRQTKLTVASDSEPEYPIILEKAVNHNGRDEKACPFSPFHPMARTGARLEIQAPRRVRRGSIIISFFLDSMDMWFKNLQIYRLPNPAELALETIEKQLAGRPLQPCDNSLPSSLGWVPPRADGGLVVSVNRQWLIALGVEQKLLPSFVVKQYVKDRARLIEEKEGRRVGRRELRELYEATTLELLPRAFVSGRTTHCWIDPVKGWLVIDAAAPAKADEVIELLHKSADKLSISPLKVTQSPSSAMTGWIASGAAPSGFSIDQDLELRSAENAVVRYAKHSLDGDEIPGHIAAGKVVTRLGMTWGDKISFVLDDKLQLKRLSFLDILKESTDGQAENEEERFELDFALMTGELALLLDDLLAALGGELLSA